jgi:acyl-CoA dehydrogenase
VDFTLSSEQSAVDKLADEILRERAGPNRLRQLGHDGCQLDRELWAQLAGAGLLGLTAPEQFGGAGRGLVDACVLLRQQGRHVALVPLGQTLVGCLALAHFGSAVQQARWLPSLATGEAVIALALAELGAGGRPGLTATRAGDRGWLLRGRALTVPWAQLADCLLLPANLDGEMALFLVERVSCEASLEPVETTDQTPHAHVILDGVQAPTQSLLRSARGGGAVAKWIFARAAVADCAVQAGLAQEALRRTAEYTTTRRQFGKPLSSFQAVAMRAADAHVDVEVMTATMWQAAWRLEQRLDAALEVEVAKWWAAEAGQRVAHTAQYLHGGIGADVDYPIHHYFLWSKQLENSLGGAGVHLARLGQLIARNAQGAPDRLTAQTDAVRAFLDALESADSEVVLALCDPDVRFEFPLTGGPALDSFGFRRWVQPVLARLGGLRFFDLQVELMLEPDCVVARYRGQATIEPGGAEYRQTYLSQFRFRDGKVVLLREHADTVASQALTARREAAP